MSNIKARFPSSAQPTKVSIRRAIIIFHKQGVIISSGNTKRMVVLSVFDIEIVAFFVLSVSSHFGFLLFSLGISVGDIVELLIKVINFTRVKVFSIPKNVIFGRETEFNKFVILNFILFYSWIVTSLVVSM